MLARGATLQALREQNDADTQEHLTHKLRGRIAECKDFLDLENQKNNEEK